MAKSLFFGAPGVVLISMEVYLVIVLAGCVCLDVTGTDGLTLVFRFNEEFPPYVDLLLLMLACFFFKSASSFAFF